MIKSIELKGSVIWAMAFMFIALVVAITISGLYGDEMPARFTACDHACSPLYVEHVTKDECKCMPREAGR